jgi:RNA polymerase sigma factor (sigma-70 family)
VTYQPTALLLSHIRRLADDAPPPDDDCLERFIARGDAAAFETLVRRHGPAVFRVCRAVLGDVHAAEDAFQATFLTLARRAATLRKRRSLASWLYKVAHRIAVRARRCEASQARLACTALPRPAVDPADEVSWREVRAIFFEEIAALPERYRAPLLLCCLEGKTRDEAAEQLGCVTGALKIRLERGRKLLRDRLARRGLGLSAGLLATQLTAAGAEAAVPTLLSDAAVRAGVGVRAGGKIADLVSARVAELSEQAVRAFAFDSLKSVLPAALICGALVAGGVSLLLRDGAAEALPDMPAVAERSADGATIANAAESPPARTDVQGDPLPAEAVSRLGSLRLRHGRHATSVRYAPTGKTLVTTGPDGVRTWETATGKQIHSLTARMSGMSFSGAPLTPDGKHVLTADDAGIHLWEMATAKQVRSFGNNKYLFGCLSPDGKRVSALASDDRQTVEVFEVESGKLLASWSPEGGPRCGIAFSPDGRSVLIDGVVRAGTPPRDDNVLRFFDARTGVERRYINLGTRIPNRVVFSPDGARLAVICVGEKPFERRLFVLDTATGKDLLRIEAPKNEVILGQDYISVVAFTPEGTSLVTAGGSPGLIEWDVVTGKEIRRFGQGTMNANDLTFSPDGKTVAVAGAGATVRLIDRSTGEVHALGAVNFTQVNETAITPDGKTVVTTGPGPTVLVWDGATGKLKDQLQTGESAQWYYRPAADGKTAFGSEHPGRTVVVRELPSGKVRSRLPIDFPGRLSSVYAISPDGSVVVAKAFTSETIHVMDAHSGKILQTIQDPSFKGCNAGLAAGGRSLFVFCPDGYGRVCDVAGGAKPRRIGPIGTPRSDAEKLAAPPSLPDVEPVNYSAAVSPDGTRIAAGDAAGHLVLFDAASGEELWRVDRPGARWSVFAFSPDCRTLAWCNWDVLSVQLFEMATGRERHVFQGHRGSLHALAFSADGKFLVSGGSDTTALVWDLTGRLAGGTAWDKPLSTAELDALWTALAGDDAAAAYTAGQRLAASRRAVGYLRERLRPARAADEKVVIRLIADLDSDRFEVREEAAVDLAKLGEAAVPACRKALAASPSAEARRRLEAIVSKCEQERRTPSGDALRMVRALEVLEHIGTPEARRLLEMIAGGTPEARQTREAKASVERLAERSSAP